MIGRSWKEIDLNAIKNNYLNYTKYLLNGQRVMAVIKADAYGHGDKKVAKTLEKLGVKAFAVSNICEAVRIRKSGVKGDILILGYTPKNAVNQLIEYDISQTVYSKEYLKTLKESRKAIKVHLAVDTGMNRLGLRADELDSRILRDTDNLKVEGLFTHLARADDVKESVFTNGQIDKFKRAVDCLGGKLNYVHYANSCGGVNYNLPFANTVRLGLLLYGIKPYDGFNTGGFKPALKWKSVVAMVKEVDKGEFVGYGKSFVTKKKIKVATVPTGYADGLDRRLSNGGEVFINGCSANIIGKICMDQFTVDVTNIDSVNVGDEVVLIGENNSAEDMAKKLDTISYEIVCKITDRVAKIYL